MAHEVDYGMQNNSPVSKAVGILDTQNFAYVTLHGRRDFADVIKDFKVGRLCQQRPKIVKGSYNREAGVSIPET